MANERIHAVVRAGIVLLAVAVVGVVAYQVFVVSVGNLAELLGLLVVVALVVLTARLAAQVARSLFPEHNVAEVAVEGPITRDGGGRLLRTPTGASADDVVDQIERADRDDAARALLVKLNTPGGQVVPSDDIRLAAERFDGPTVAYATDTCASGGYWIASGCDELWAREGSLVGSIGVIGSRINAKELADRIGISYERLAAGEFKDAGTPLKEFEDEEREYLQSVVDGYYDTFVERVAEGRGMDPEAVRETEARVYLGPDAAERGLVDEVATREAVEDRLTEAIDEEARIREFEPQRGLAARFRAGVASLAFAFGAGLASVVTDGEFDLRL